MSYLGKEYKFVKGENFDEFAKSLEVIGIPAALLTHFHTNKPISKLVKNGDTYTITNITSEKTISVNFKFGEGTDIEYVPGVKLYTEFTIEGDTIIQIIKRTKDDDKFVTLKREYNGDELKMTITSNFWDGAAFRYYSV